MTVFFLISLTILMCIDMFEFEWMWCRSWFISLHGHTPIHTDSMHVFGDVFFVCQLVVLFFLGVGKKHSKLKTQKLNFFRWVFLSQLNGAMCVETPRHFGPTAVVEVPLCLFRLYRAKPLRERHVFDPFHLCLPIGVLEGVDVDKCLGLWTSSWWVHKMMEKTNNTKNVWNSENNQVVLDEACCW